MSREFVADAWVGIAWGGTVTIERGNGTSFARRGVRLSPDCPGPVDVRNRQFLARPHATKADYSRRIGSRSWRSNMPCQSMMRLTWSSLFAGGFRWRLVMRI